MSEDKHGVRIVVACAWCGKLWRHRVGGEWTTTPPPRGAMISHGICPGCAGPADTPDDELRCGHPEQVPSPVEHDEDDPCAAC